MLELKLEDVCTKIVDCEHRTAPVVDSTEEVGYPSIRTMNIGFGRLLLDRVNRVSEQVYREWTKRTIPESGDLILAREAPIGNVAIIPENMQVCLGQRTVLIRPDKQLIEPAYLMYLLLSNAMQKRIKTLSGGGTVHHLNVDDIKSLPLPELVSLVKQRKIVDILGTWDAAIGTVERFIAALQVRKRGLMLQLLIPRDGTGQPLVRFPQFQDKWKIQRLDCVFDRVTRKNAAGNDNVLTASGQYGLVSQIEYFNRSVAGASLDNYYLIERGEFAYNRSSSDGYPYGAIKQLEKYDAGVLSTLYICFRLTNEAADPTFYKHFFEAGGLDRGIYSIAQEGARNHGLLNVGISDFFSLDIPLPLLHEQKYLADLFKTQDRLIGVATSYRNHLQQQKQGLMQRLLTGQVRVRVDEE